MTIDEKIQQRLQKDGLTIEDLTPEQLETVREEMREKKKSGRNGVMLDGFFSSMEYISLTFRKRSK